MVKPPPIEYSCSIAITRQCEHPTPPVNLEVVARVLDEAMILLEDAHLRATRMREKERLYQLLDEYRRNP